VLLFVRWFSAAVVTSIVTSIVTVIAVSCGHIEVTMVPMPVSLADANSDRTDYDFGVFRDDRRFVAGVQSTGECRHGQERNNKKGKQRILHDTLFWLARPLAPTVGRMRVFCSCSLYRIDQCAIWNNTFMRPFP
jgi:hypothetical protein